MEIIVSGLNYIMPEKAVFVHCNDATWISDDLKRLIKRRQQTFSSGNSISFKFYRNKVNSTRKACRSRFYASKVNHLKQAKSKKWWREVKRICSVNSISSTTDLFCLLQIENADNLLPIELANLMNDAFLEPMKEFSAINEIVRDTDQPPSSHDTSFANISSPLSTFHKHKALNPSKACGPNCIPTWVLKEYAEILASPISYVLNTSYREQTLPSTWKKANVIPIPKDKPIRDINRHLRPISLTPTF